MPKRAKVLTAVQVARLSEPGTWFVGEVPGLALQVTPAGARCWVLRFAVGARRREMGLGSYPGVTLAGAREAARKARELLREGIDPIDTAKAKRSALAAEAAKALTFDQCARAYIDAHAKGWRNAKHSAQWAATLETYASPTIGSMLVRDVALPHVLRILEPIWSGKTETASRVRGRIESVLDWAKVRGYRDGDNPARWRGHLDKLLPKPGKVARKANHPALDWREAGDFWAELGKVQGMGAVALRFAVLTAARSEEVRSATWSEIDFDRAEWTIPAARMKADREHRVPLSAAALEVLRALPRIEGCELVFPSAKGAAISDATMAAVIKRMHEAATKAGGAGWIDRRQDGRIATPHGIARSTFRDWTAEATAYPHEVAEMALAHTIKNKAEAAYRRGDLFDKRRRLMNDWAAFLATPSAKAGTVTPIRGAA